MQIVFDSASFAWCDGQFCLPGNLQHESQMFTRLTSSCGCHAFTLHDHAQKSEGQMTDLRLGCLTGNHNKDLPMQLLRKTESVEVHGRHGNPFSDDGSNEERHDKSPLLIGSADSSYNMDTPRR